MMSISKMRGGGKGGAFYFFFAALVVVALLNYIPGISSSAGTQLSAEGARGTHSPLGPKELEAYFQTLLARLTEKLQGTGYSDVWCKEDGKASSVATDTTGNGGDGVWASCDATKKARDIVVNWWLREMTQNDKERITVGLNLLDSVSLSWTGAKKYIGSTHEETMRKVWEFRKWLVDYFLGDPSGEKGQKGRITDLFRNLQVFAFGSTNLSSDYDWTVQVKRGPNLPAEDSRNDVNACMFYTRLMNALFKGKSSAEVFDTNIYATSDISVADFSSSPSHFKVLDELHEDVLALLKIRRYMSGSQWDEFKNNITSEMKKGGNNNANNVEGVQETTELLFKSVEKEFLAWTNELYEKFKINKKKMSPTDSDEFPEVVGNNLDPIWELLDDSKNEWAVVKASETIYLEKLSFSRELEVVFFKLVQDIRKASTTVDVAAEDDVSRINRVTRSKRVGSQTAERLDSLAKRARVSSRLPIQKAARDILTDHVKTILGRHGESETDALLVLILRLNRLATPFANEAYFSTGPYVDIVKAPLEFTRTQSVPGSVSEKKTQAEKLDIEYIKFVKENGNLLTIPHLMQSLNEQFGDFLKDAKHYVAEKFFVQSSKYVSRLLRAVIFLCMLQENNNIGSSSSPSSNNNSQCFHHFQKYAKLAWGKAQELQEIRKTIGKKPTELEIEKIAKIIMEMLIDVDDDGSQNNMKIFPGSSLTKEVYITNIKGLVIQMNATYRASPFFVDKIFKEGYATDYTKRIANLISKSNKVSTILTMISESDRDFSSFGSLFEKSTGVDAQVKKTL